jgi:hypothetical protein
MAKKHLDEAKTNKKDEFYTQYKDIEKELNAYVEYNPDIFKDKVILLPCDDFIKSNFTKYFTDKFFTYKLKALISTSYTKDGKGLMYVKDRDKGEAWTTLEGDGDFHSDEVSKLRDEADIIITNPPFSLFRDFFKWIMDGGKKFLIIGNINCITYKKIFNQIKDNNVWLGTGLGRWISGFIVPDDYELTGTEAKMVDGQRIVATNNCLWLTNLDHGKRHEDMELSTMEENLKNNKTLLKRLEKAYGVKEYPKYDNYDAIEVPLSEAIPSDYKGVMGVPITFLDKYNPDKFEIIKFRKGNDDKDLRVNGKSPYFRILIKQK